MIQSKIQQQAENIAIHPHRTALPSAKLQPRPLVVVVVVAVVVVVVAAVVAAVVVVVAAAVVPIVITAPMPHRETAAYLDRTVVSPPFRGAKQRESRSSRDRSAAP